MVAELHARAIGLGGHLELAGIFDVDESKAQRRAAEWSCPAYASYDDVLADDEVDAVLVLTRADTHADVATRAMSAGKHVLIEKPVGSTADITSLISHAQRVGKVCLPGHNYAYQPEFVRMRSLVRSGDLGRIRAAWITYVIGHSEDVARQYGGVLEELMIHHAYLAVALFGRPSSISAGRSTPGWTQHPADDQAWFALEYHPGLHVQAFASFAVSDATSTPWTFVVKVLGTQGGVTYNWQDAAFARPLGSLPIALPAYEDSYIHEHAAFAAAIGGQPDAIMSTIEDALQAGELIAAAQESADEGVRVDLQARSGGGA
jgi:predicted dehydrogenase